MNYLTVMVLIAALKLPLLWCGYFIYRAIKDVPEPEIEDNGDEFVRGPFEPGPRQRGPRGGTQTRLPIERRPHVGRGEQPAAPSKTSRVGQ